MKLQHHLGMRNSQLIKPWPERGSQGLLKQTKMEIKIKTEDKIQKSKIPKQDAQPYVSLPPLPTETWPIMWMERELLHAVLPQNPALLATSATSFSVCPLEQWSATFLAPGMVTPMRI